MAKKNALFFLYRMILKQKNNIFKLQKLRFQKRNFPRLNR